MQNRFKPATRLVVLASMMVMLQCCCCILPIRWRTDMQRPRPAEQRNQPDRLLGEFWEPEALSGAVEAARDNRRGVCTAEGVQYRGNPGLLRIEMTRIGP